MTEKSETNMQHLTREVCYVPLDDFYDVIGASEGDQEYMNDALSNSCVSFGTNYMTMFDAEVAEQIWEGYLSEEARELLDQMKEAGVPLAVNR